MTATCSRFVMVVATLLGLAATATGAEATEYHIVDNLPVDDPGTCTLGEAMLAATSNSAVDACLAGSEDDLVVVDVPGGFALAANLLPAEIHLSIGTLIVRGNRNHPAESYFVDLEGDSRFLRVSGGTLVVENLHLYGGRPASGGTEGGAILVTPQGDLTLRDVILEASQARTGGAVLFNTVDGTLHVERTRFVGNLATAGASQQAQSGALAVQLNGAGEATILDSDFAGNSAVVTDPSGSAFYGALGILAFDSGSQITVRQVSVTDSLVDAASGSAAVSVSTPGSLLVEDLTLTDNTVAQPSVAGTIAGLALGIGGESAHGEVRRLRLLRNRGTSAPIRGMQAQLSAGSGATLTVSNVLVADGSARGLYLDGQNGATILAGNLTVTGHVEGLLAAPFTAATVRVENSIAWGNDTDVVTFGTSPDIDATLNHNLFGVDPQFVDDLLDHRLQPTSPAIGTGDRTFASVGPFDAAHATRIIGSEVDAGALEHDGVFAWDGEEADLVAWSAVQPLP